MLMVPTAKHLRNKNIADPGPVIPYSSIQKNILGYIVEHCPNRGREGGRQYYIGNPAPNSFPFTLFMAFSKKTVT